MTHLTPEERQRIYEEEKERFEAQEKLKAEKNRLYEEAETIREKEQRVRRWVGVVGVGGTILLLLIGLGSYFDNPQRPKKDVPMKETFCSDDNYGIWLSCQVSKEFVKDRLVAPATAKFPPCVSYEEDRVNAEYRGDCKYHIKGYVDAQNSFGAMIRHEYFCEIQYNKGDLKPWRLLDIKILER